MKLKKTQSEQLLREHGIWVTESCDRCGGLLGAVRWTRRGEPGEFCSALCRDGTEHRVGVCRGCGVSLKGKRKGTIYCDHTCRVRDKRHIQDQLNKPHTPIQNTELTDAISRPGYLPPSGAV